MVDAGVGSAEQKGGPGNGVPGDTLVIERSMLRAGFFDTWFGFRSGEAAVAWLFFLYFFVLASAHYAVKSLRQATYVDAMGADNLPWVYLLVALVSLPILLLYSRLSERFQPQTLIFPSCALHSLTLVAFYWLFGLEQRWVPVVFYIWATVAFGVAVSQLWSFASFVFDPRQARRLFAFVGAGGLLGGIPGGLLARTISTRFGSYFTLIVAAVLLLGVAGIVFAIERVRPPARGVLHSEERLALKQSGRGMKAVLGSRLLELIALLMLLTMIAAQMVDLQFNWAIESVTQTLDQRTRVFGSFFSVMGLAGFIFQVVFTRRIHRALGVGFGMRVMPVTIALTTFLLFLAVGFFPAAVVSVAWLLKLGESGLRHSVDQATRELLFLPVPGPVRRRGKTFIDVFVQRFAKGAAALLLLPVTFGFLDIRHVGFMTLVVVGLWLWVVALARREYVDSFRQGLKSGNQSEQADIDVSDVTTITTLVESLGSSDPREVLHSIDLLFGNGQGRLVPPLLLYHHDPAVRERTIHVLTAVGRTDAVGLLQRALSDENPDVRGAAISALAVLRKENAVEMMSSHLDDRDARLRAAAVAFLLELGGAEWCDRATTVLGEMLTDSDAGVRCEAAKALGQLPDPTGTVSLIQLFYDSNLNVIREAIRAVRKRLGRGERSPLYVPILISLMGNRRLKHDARETIVGYGEQAIQALVLFMGSVDEQVWVRRAVPKTIALIGGDAAVEALMNNLDVSDSFLRAKVIQALASLRRDDPKLVLKAKPIRQEVREEASRFLRDLADLLAVSSKHHLLLEGPRAGLRSTGLAPTFLQQLLTARMARSVENIFNLLSLLLQPGDVRAASTSLMSRQAPLHARALEYLDNTLSGSLRRDVFTVIDDAPPEDKVRRGEQHFGIAVDDEESTLRRLIGADIEVDPDRLSLVTAALLSVHGERISGLYPAVVELTEGPDEMIRETAAWVVRKLGERRDGSEDPGNEPHGKGVRERTGDLAAMARIEMMVFLQGVDLFSYCDAEQVFRLAAIARETVFSEGDGIYRRSASPDALYCVVAGRVELVDAEGAREEIGPKGRFGVHEILSGRLRACDAVAARDSRVLVIEADDFFDLLSNNIEIVKALFRQVTQPVTVERDGLM